MPKVGGVAAVWRFLGAARWLTASDYLTTLGYAMAMWTILRVIDMAPGRAAAYSAVLYISALALLRTYREWSSGETFDLIALSMGTLPYDDIIATQRKILVTHFSHIVPSVPYVTLMKEKMEDGVRITRVLPSGIDKDSESYSWLNEFTGQPGYEERTVNMTVLPIDVYVMDDLRVLLQFPDSSGDPVFRNGLLLSNEHVAEMFRTSLDRLGGRAGHSGP